MSHYFCRYLTNGLRIQSWHGTLAAAPCCYLELEPIKSLNFNKVLENYRLRTHCTECNSFSNGDPIRYPPNRSKRIVPDSDHTYPVYVEFSIDNKCNAACLSCSDGFSSLWEKQNVKFNIKSKDDYPDPQNDQAVVDEIFRAFDFSYLKLINFLGGEPLISETTWLVLEQLRKLNLANHIEIIFTTNGSVVPKDSQLELLVQFKKVTFQFSIDGLDEQSYYLRYPLRWEKVNQNFNLLNENKNFIVSVNTTVSSLNAFYLDQLQSWVNDTQWTLAECNGILSIQSLPNSALDFLKNKYQSDPKISAIFHKIKTNKSTSDLIDYLKLWDQNRNLDWKTIFPLAVPYFNG
jgi:molybdenum cofactor biosynthesis enzyme MoaA